MRKITKYRIFNFFLTILSSLLLFLVAGGTKYSSRKKLDKVYTKYWDTKYRKYIRKYKLYKKQGAYLSVLINQICQLNPSARNSQVNILKEIYSDDAIPFLDDRSRDKTPTEAFAYLKKKETKDWKDVFSMFFKLTIADDGIKNDEWNLLQSYMKGMGFNSNWINYFNQRYQPLRTEFDSYSYTQQQSNDYSSNYSVDYRKPYYVVLGLDSNASPEEVKKAYHQLAMEHHPDLPKNANRKEECEAIMAKINEAYAKISAN